MSFVLKVENLWICQCLTMGCHNEQVHYKGKTYQGVGRSAKANKAHQDMLEKIEFVCFMKLFEKHN